MIEYNNIEEIPDLSKPRLFNGVKILVFDSIQEHNNYLNSIKTWSKDYYCNSITQEIQNIVDNKAREFDYDDIKDVPTENFEGGVYQQEAISLLSWASNLWLLRDAYFKTLNSEQDINNNFIENLPKFNING